MRFLTQLHGLAVQVARAGHHIPPPAALAAEAAAWEPFTLAVTELLGGDVGPQPGRAHRGCARTCAGTVFTLLGAGAAVYARFKAFLPPLSVVRGGLAGAGAFAAAMYIPHGGAVMSVAALAGGFFAFLWGLVVTGELGRDEIKAARGALGVSPPVSCIVPPTEAEQRGTSTERQDADRCP